MPQPTARQLALDALREWDRSPAFAHDIIDRLATERGLESRDTALLQTLVLATLRNLTLLDHWAGKLCDWERVEPPFRWTLRLGLVQLLVLDIAPHAAVNETVRIAGRVRTLVNAVLRRAQRESGALLQDAAQQPASISHSHPEWLMERWSTQFGKEQAESLAAWNQQPSPIFIRLNRLHPQMPAAEETGSAEPIGSLGFYKVEQPPRDWLAQGKCYAQDPSTALACELLAPQPEESVLDACAAPGGKAALLAQMMEDRGHLFACDSVPRRLTRLQENLRRLRVSNARVVKHDWLKPTSAPPWGALRFDRILLDAPCSNTGVMRRRVDVRWRLQPSAFAEMASLQGRMLDAALPLLKSGGSLVYSTCSLDAGENEQIVEAFLRRHPEMRCTQMKYSLPWRDGFDGAFAALITGV